MLGSTTTYASPLTKMPVKMEGQPPNYITNQSVVSVSSPYMTQPTYTSLFRRGGSNGGETTPDSSTAAATAAYPPMFGAASMFSAAADPLYGLHDMSTAGNYGGYAGSMAAYGYMSPYYR